MREPRYVIADVFAGAPFQGNQLAVFPDGRGLSTDEMQRAANEIGYSETTFLFPPEGDDHDLVVRIFTPQVELPFAGHPLVGSGFVAAVRRLVPCDPGVLRLRTGVGVIEVRPEIASNRSGRALMTQPFPTLVAEMRDAGLVAELASAFGVPSASVDVSASPIAVMDNGLQMAVVPLDSLATVRAMSPNPREIARVCEELGAKTVLAYTLETEREGSAAHCRVFAPGAGVGEDPATGSANGPFGVYLSRYELVAGDRVVVEQGFEMGRPSILEVTLGRDASGEVSGVTVGGGVFVTGEGSIYFE
jgi:trans-2,3-dihydro-3-hydroxyanthranilate isomerase